MKFLLHIITIGITILYSALPHPCPPTKTPKTLEEAIQSIQKMAEKQEQLQETLSKLDNTMNRMYKRMVDNDEDIPVPYKPEVVAWLKKQDEQNEDKKNF